MEQSVHNEMAKHAYEAILKRKSDEQELDEREFRSLARSFPSMVQVNGLGASLAFLKTKGEGAWTHMYEMIEDWINQKFGGENKELLARITEANSDTYRIYTKEIMDYSIWVKRFAEGLLKKK